MNSPEFKLGVILYLPILCIPLKHQRIFWLADLSRIIILNLLDILLSLNALVFGKCAVMAFLEALSVCCQPKILPLAENEMTYSSCMSEEVRSHRLNISLCSR